MTNEELREYILLNLKIKEIELAFKKQMNHPVYIIDGDNNIITGDGRHLGKADPDWKENLGIK